MNAREDYIASQYKPKPPQPGPPGSGPGSQGNVNSNPANDFIGSSQDTSVYYGNLPQSQGNTNVNVSNPLGGNYQGPPVINNDGSSGSDSNTGAGATGGSGGSGGSLGGSGLATLAGIDASKKFLGVNPGGIDTLINQNAETYGLSGQQNQKDLTKMESTQPDFTPTIDLGQKAGFQDKVNNVIGFKALKGDFGLNDYGLGYTSGSGNTQLGVNVGLDGQVTLGGNLKWGNAAGGLIEKYAHGGPVGLMSLPHGYEDGGQVIPATSIDPTADDYFLKEFYKYMKRYLPGYDKEQDYYRQRKNRERMKREALKEEKYQGYDPESPPPSEKYPTYDPDNPNHFMVPEGMDPKLFKPGTPTLEAAEGGEVKPFGGTRENVMDQIEAFDNAPVHMEEPMVGMYGEKVPLTIARKVQNYMEGLDPVKRDMIQEMMNMFQVKKQQEKMQQMEEDSQGGFFGPQPNEYGV